MKFKDLTGDKKEFFISTYLRKDIQYTEKIKILVEFIGKKTDRTIQRWIKKLDLSKNKEIAEPICEEFEAAKLKTLNPTKRKFIVTWAQSNTPIHTDFFDNVEAYAEWINAEIHVIAGRYLNPTSIYGDDKKEKWDSRTIPYLDAARHNLHKYVKIMSDVKIQPTATNPISGLESLSGSQSCIFGHPKVHFSSAPVLEGNQFKMMVTTGACTTENYSDSKAGKKGEFNHELGFVIIEIKDEEIFFIRQVTADSNGDFIDLIHEVKKEESISSIKRVDRISACVLGDLHCGKHDEEVLNRTLDFLDKLEPEHVVLHDIFDGDSINHHEINDPFVQFQKEIKNKNSLGLELENMFKVLNRFKKFKHVIIVRSNHDDFLDRWIRFENWKTQPTAKNSMQYMEFSKMLLTQYAEDRVIGIIPELISEKYTNFTPLTRMSSFLIEGWEVSQHGDLGANGSRGSLKQFRKLNTKIIVGHYHTPGRLDRTLAVGTSTKLRLGYNQGPSGWLNSHVLIHKNGTAQHINFNDRAFTTFKI
jgi:hypothetical protein